MPYSVSSCMILQWACQSLYLIVREFHVFPGYRIIVIYILPLTAGKGADCLKQLPTGCWKLHRSKTFKDGITRIIYRKSSR